MTGGYRNTSKSINRPSSALIGIPTTSSFSLLPPISRPASFQPISRALTKKPGDTAFGSKLPLGELLQEYSSTSWVHSAKWSPSGNRFAYLSHDAHIGFVDVSGGAPGNTQLVRLRDLPVVDFIWVNEDSIVAVGHDCNPILFSHQGGNWVETRRLDDQGASAAAAKKGTGTDSRAAFDLFKNKVEVGQNTNITALNTRHQNTITCIVAYKLAGTNVQEFTTTGLDGLIEVWKV